MPAAIGKKSTVEQRYIRLLVQFTVTSLKINPSHGARHGPTMPQYMYHKSRDMPQKAQKKQCSAILERWYKDDLCRGSLSKLGWNEETIMEYDKIALEDHSYTATKEEIRRNDNSWKLSLNAKGANGPVDQRDDFNDAKEMCERPCYEHTAITGCGNTPNPPQQQVRQRPNQQFEGHTNNIRLDLIHLDGNLMFPPQCIRPTSSSRWQPSNWST